MFFYKHQCKLTEVSTSKYQYPNGTEPIKIRAKPEGLTQQYIARKTIHPIKRNATMLS